MTRPRMIISGGQTGADQGALEAAITLGIPTGGTAPEGWRTEVGFDTDLRDVFGLDGRGSYAQRTIQNVKNSQATIVFALWGGMGRGSALTVRWCERLRRPYAVVYVGDGSVLAIRTFLGAHMPAILNVAGPRESRCPGIQGRVRDILCEALAETEGSR